VPRARLHLDADTSSRSLCRALLDRGHDVTRTPTSWMPFDASDETQLLGATAQGRAIFTFNVRDFVPLSRAHPHHQGIVLAARRSWALSSLIGDLDRLLANSEAQELIGQVVWLSSDRA
jgi:hypothetical protein